jgi:hypothetical protein
MGWSTMFSTGTDDGKAVTDRLEVPGCGQALDSLLDTLVAVWDFEAALQASHKVTMLVEASDSGISCCCVHGCKM